MLESMGKSECSLQGWVFLAAFSPSPQEVCFLNRNLIPVSMYLHEVSNFSCLRVLRLMCKQKASHKIKLMKCGFEQISEIHLPACLGSLGRKRFSLIISKL
ncbi:unnamed protein product [Rangifer tarandus platyrhynchus]|uniref:Uncharacterized protein n=1 Tax=Rangifer tarandus platyrhynchus TaxID=3082113 RepID=A0AC60A0Z3_RANTA